jgi:hypothetical protein
VARLTKGHVHRSELETCSSALGEPLGGSIVFVRGMRMLNLSEEPALRAMAPGGEEKSRTEAG